MENDWMALLQQENQLKKIVETNIPAQQFGLVLSNQDARIILDERNKSLKKYRRVEFGEEITQKLICEFCDSGFIDQNNYTDTIVRLQDIFYHYKNEMQNKITDDELLHLMKEQFEFVCSGDLDYLEGACLSNYARSARQGHDGYKKNNGYGEYLKFDDVRRRDYDLYTQMDYTMEELIPVVSKLAERYTSYESTSIPYEKAEQLMGAVIYCIREAPPQKKHSIISSETTGAQQAYENGVFYVEEKIKKALSLYNKTVSKFSDFENKCLHDTVIKGLPEFFKWYDITFNPQDTILTLDYPVLEDLSGCTGIDKIYSYIRCIYLEQRFLKRFPKKYVMTLLDQHHILHRDMIFNLCEIVFTAVTGHLLAQKPMSEPKLEDSDYQKIQDMCMQMPFDEMKLLLEESIRIFVKQYCRNCKGLSEYLFLLLDDIIIRLKNAALYHALPRVI